MPDLPEKIAQTSTSMIRGHDRPLGRTLAHSLDVLVDHLRSCMQMLNQSDQRNEENFATSKDRIDRLEVRLNAVLSEANMRLQAAERCTTDVVSGVAALEEALSSERQRTSLLESRLATLEARMDHDKNEADAAHNNLSRQFNNVATLLSVFTTDDNNAIYNFVNQLERLLSVVNGLENRVKMGQATDIVNTAT